MFQGTVTAFVLFTLLYFSSYSQKPISSVKSSQPVYDSVYYNNIIGSIKKYHSMGRFDSVLYYIKKANIQEEQKKTNRVNAELFFYYALYFRNIKDTAQITKMTNKSLFYAQIGNHNELIEDINYLRLSRLSGKFLTTNDFKDQKNLLTQFYNNIEFSEKTKSKKNLYKSYYLIKDIYRNYNQDSSFYTHFGNQFFKTFSSPLLIRNQIFYFDYFIHKKKYKKADQYLDSIINTFNTKKEVSESIYSYMLNEMMFTASDHPPLSKKISIYLKSRVSLLPYEMDKLLFFNNFTKLHLSNNNIKEARRYHHQAESILKKNNSMPLSLKLYFLLNEQVLLKKEKRVYESLKLYEKIIPIQTRINDMYSVFNFTYLQLQAVNNYKLKQTQNVINLKKQETRLIAEKNKKEKIFLYSIISILLIAICIVSIQATKINKQKNSLQKLTNNQNTIFTVIGHDLRSPIISIYTALLSTLNKSTGLDIESQVSLKEKAIRLNSFILTLDNLLNWANSQQTSFKIKPTQVVLIDILEEVLELLASNIEQAEVTIQSQILPDVYCFMDENHLKIILRNLIQNSIKFTPKHGSVLITSIQKDTYLMVKIQDTGIGFSASFNSPHKGSGLGLELVQTLISMNKGTFIQTDTDKGALVTLLLPIT